MSVDITKTRGPNGEHATFFICSRGGGRKAPPCCSCQKPSTLLCDYPLRGKAQGRTCSRPLCEACTVRGAATHLGALGSGHREIDTFDLCPTHTRIVESKQPCTRAETIAELGLPSVESIIERVEGDT